MENRMEHTSLDDKVVLSAHNLKKTYIVSKGLMKGKANVRALNGVSFELRKGKTLAIVGESGCGKSTLARQLTLIENPSEGYLKFGENKVDYHNKKDVRELRRNIQMVFQNPYGSLNPRRKIEDQLEEPLIMNTDMSKQERKTRIEEIMRLVGLRPEHAFRYPHMFSGGQRQRIAIARAMILNPNIVVADEPTSALDVSIQAQILNLFMDLQEELHTAYIFISHNLAVVEHVADDVMVMYLGKVVEMGRKEEIYSNPSHPYTRALLSASPSVSKDNRIEKIKIQGELPSPLNPPSGCAFHKRCPNMRPICAGLEPELLSDDACNSGHLVACHFANKNAQYELESDMVAVEQALQAA